ncbi:SHOCT domain-containing protein [Demequina salsinemoris]|uniref:SHOCT domain-containing protein n=1 Tax=Demequina salsinemoris TaxID=577470 RepID=UPI000783CE2C|nr:SHOCT domain-containing protein [Demequina salsinemoris]
MSVWTHGYGMMGYGYGSGLEWLVWLFVIVAVGAAVYIAVRLAQRDKDAKKDDAAVAPAAPTSARQILEDRLARGEIDPDEFRERVNALEGA